MGVKPMLYRLQSHLQTPGAHSPVKANATPATQDVPTAIGIGKSPSYVTNGGEPFARALGCIEEGPLAESFRDG